MKDRTAFEIDRQLPALFDQSPMRDIAARHEPARQIDDIADLEILEIFALDGGRQNLFHSTTPSWERIS